MVLLGQGDYRVLYNIAGNGIKFSPSMDIDFTNKDLISDMGNFLKGDLSCDIFKRYKFNYVIEKNLLVKPECLELKEISGAYRLWKVKI